MSKDDAFCEFDVSSVAAQEVRDAEFRQQEVSLLEGELREAQQLLELEKTQSSKMREVNEQLSARCSMLTKSQSTKNQEFNATIDRLTRDISRLQAKVNDKPNQKKR